MPHLETLLTLQAGMSNMKATLKEKVAHVKADVVEAGQKLTHPTNPAYKMAATQEVRITSLFA